MGSSIFYYFDIDRSSTGFTLNADYHIDGAYDPYTGAYYPQTRYEFDYRDSGGVIDSSSGYGGETVSVRDSFAFDTDAGIATNRLEFTAYNTYDGYGFYFTWNVYDAGLETTSQTLSGSNDTDIMFGGRAADALRGFGDDDWLDGGAGADTLTGGTGDDTYIVDNVGDRTLESGGAGDDTVRSSVTYTLASNVETLDLTGTRAINGTGNTLANTLVGNDAANVLAGGSGRDTLFGEGGADTFQFRALGDSTVASSGRDLIRDFSRAQGDHVDLQLIDADTTLSGNQGFDFIGAPAFTGEAGELRSVVSGSTTVVSGDVNGDATADFAITLQGRYSLTAGDFLL